MWHTRSTKVCFSFGCWTFEGSFLVPDEIWSKWQHPEYQNEIQSEICTVLGRFPFEITYHSDRKIIVNYIKWNFFRNISSSFSNVVFTSTRIFISRLLIIDCDAPSIQQSCGGSFNFLKMKWFSISTLGGFPIKIITKIRYLIICCYLNRGM